MKKKIDAEVSKALKRALTKRGSDASRKKAYAKGRQGGLRDDYVPVPPRGFVGTRGDAKWVDTAQATYAVDTTGSITHISIVPQGTSVNAREGKAFRCTSVNIRGFISANSAATQNDYQCCLVWDYSPQKVLPAITDIFDSVTSLSFPKRENNERFKIVKKYKGILLGNSAAPTTGDETFHIDDYVKLPKDANVLCTTGDTTGAIGDVIQGALYWVTMGFHAPSATLAAVATMGFRVNFTDKTK